MINKEIIKRNLFSEVFNVLSKTQIAVNPSYVTAVFVASGGDHEGKTIIGMSNGTIVVEEGQLDVVGKLQGEYSK